MAAEGNPLLAADGGANHLARIGLRPQHVIGDLDSIFPSTRSWLGEGPLVPQPDQDRCDLDKALTYAFDEMGLERLTVLAALGGRPDHDIGNLGLLSAQRRGTDLIFLQDESYLLAFSGEIALEAAPGETWSFWTFDPAVRVTLRGVRWPVTEAALDAGGRPSISNVAESDEVHARADGGAVVAMRLLGKVAR
jgi:thiamine pyrophosphokinase